MTSGAPLHQIAPKRCVAKYNILIHIKNVHSLTLPVLLHIVMPSLVDKLSNQRYSENCFSHPATFGFIALFQPPLTTAAA